MDGRLTWTDCDEARDYVVPNVLSPRDLVSRPDNMDETVTHTSRHREVENRTENELHIQIYRIITPPTLSHYNIVSLITQSFLWTEKTVLE